MAKPDDVDLPEREFTYLAGNADRPWQQFTGRWKAMQPILQDMLQSCSKDRPLRVVDLGSCSGFFALKAAYRHPEADVVAIEGSVGVGNGTTGMEGTTAQILRTDAVQTHLRWIQRLRLTNCFVAPEVWDYAHVCELAKSGRPICDAMFMLSVIHHIDNISVDQYKRAGFARADGGIDLIAKLLLLSPRHFVEMPNQPWMKDMYAKYGTAKRILEAATEASGRRWAFRGPIHSAEWFGQRDVWVIEVQDPMPDVDIQSCPFPELYRGDEQALLNLNTSTDSRMAGFNSMPLMGLEGLDPLGDNAPWGGALADANLGAMAACENLPRVTMLDPGLTAMAGLDTSKPVSGQVGTALQAAPTALLLAHLALREATAEAQDVLLQSRKLQGEQPLPAAKA